MNKGRAMYTTEIEKCFLSIKEGNVKINPFTKGAPVKIMIGRPIGTYLISIMSTPIKNAFDIQSKAVLVKEYLNDDGSYRYDLILRNIKYKDLFIKLCSDLFAYVQTEKDPIKYVAKIASRYTMWSKFWKNEGHQITDEVKQGLLGELLYLNRLLDKGINADSAVQSWKGPEGGNQDFIGDGWWSEIKTIRLSANTIKISSIEQLDANSTASRDCYGYLVVYRINRDSPNHKLDLRDLIEKTHSRLKNYPNASQIFSNNLEILGWNDDVAKIPYTAELIELSIFDATAQNFPKISRKYISSAIANATYAITLSNLSQWMLKDEEFK